jgi:hypothetical protein
MGGEGNTTAAADRASWPARPATRTDSPGMTRAPMAATAVVVVAVMMMAVAVVVPALSTPVVAPMGMRLCAGG